jgi:hypothetical protein
MNHHSRYGVGPVLLLLALALFPLVTLAQGAKVRMPDFASLADKAKESIEISLDGEDIQDVSTMMGGRGTASDPRFTEMLQGLRGIYVRMFEFDRPGQYSSRDIDSVIRQVERGGWKRLLYVRNPDERMELWLREGGPDGGLLVVVSEPLELVFINIVGKVDLETLRQLQGRMGVPHVPGIDKSPAPPASPAPETSR